MKSGFAHFDDSHRENFCAAVLLLTLEIEDDVRAAIANAVLTALGITAACELVSAGREARLAVEDEEEGYARVDLWLLFRQGAEHFYAFIEVKSHERWDARAVADQVTDQAAHRRLVRSAHEIRGSVLLAPARLCERVRLARDVPTLSWTTLLNSLRVCARTSRLTQHAVRHLEEHVDRPIGIADRTLSEFQQATTTIACLREFLAACVADIGGALTKGLNMTPGDGEPLRWSGWAWHGISVPFTLDGKKHRLGIYNYIETPPGEEASLEMPWLEAYEDSAQDPIAFVPFNPPTLAPSALDAARAQFQSEWRARQGAVSR
jgi:hypothetical protein